MVDTGLAGRVREARLRPAAVESAGGAGDEHLALLYNVPLCVALVQEREEGNGRVHGADNVDPVCLGHVLDRHLPELLLNFLEGERAAGIFLVARQQRAVVGSDDSGVGDDQVDVAGLLRDVRSRGLERRLGGGVALEGDQFAWGEVRGRCRGFLELLETPAEDVYRRAVRG